MRTSMFKSTPIEDTVGPRLAPIIAQDPVPWFKKRHLVTLNLLLLIPILSCATTGYDGSLMNGLQSLDTWKREFGYPKGEMLGFVNAAQCLGAFVGSLITGSIADKFGRKKVLGIGLSGVVVATVIQASSGSLAQLIVSRWIVGIFGQLAAQSAPLLIQELAYPSFRGKYTAVYNTFFYAGSILASWTCYGVSKRVDSWGWRIPTILQMGYPIIQLVFIWLLPESPRWLVSKSRYSDAKEILVRYHAGGDQTSELVKIEMSEIVDAIEMEQRFKSTSWKELVKTPGNRKRTYIGITIAAASQWAGNAVISYYFTLVLDTIGYHGSTTQTLINGLLQIFNFSISIISALLVDRLGRRTLLLWSSIGMFASFICWTVLSAKFNATQTKVYGQGVLAFIFIYFFNYDIGYTPLVVSYPAEIFPFYLRSKGLAVTMATVQASLVVGSFCNSIAMDKLGWHYYIVFCCIDAFIILNTYFFFPETKGYSLEEIAEIFDGCDHDHDHDHHPELDVERDPGSDSSTKRETISYEEDKLTSLQSFSL